MDGSGGARSCNASHADAGTRHRRQDRSLALARARSAHGGGLFFARGSVMDQSRRSRKDTHGHRRIGVSFEFFPPKTEEMEKNLWEAITRLAPFAPNFVSVTYGAGGSTRERTHATVKRMLEETPLTPAAHLTCVAATRGEVDEVIRN